jgi:hypothetical protein
MSTYRVIHRLHHNHLYGPQDPDIALHGGYPRGKAYLLKKLGKDLGGLTAWKTYAYFFGAPALNTRTNVVQRPLDDTSPKLREAFNLSSESDSVRDSFGRTTYGQSCLLERRLVEADQATALLLWGPPGTGKSFAAEAIADHLQRSIIRMM